MCGCDVMLVVRLLWFLLYMAVVVRLWCDVVAGCDVVLVVMLWQCDVVLVMCVVCVVCCTV